MKVNLNLKCRGQSSIEAALLIAFMSLLLVMFVGIIADKVAETREKKDKQLMEDLGYVVETEIKMAAASEDGYIRAISIPPNLEGKDYQIDLFSLSMLKNPSDTDPQHSEIIIKYTDYMPFYEHLIYLPKNVNGTICAGNNLIQKNKGIVNVTCNCLSGYIDKDTDTYTVGYRYTFCSQPTLPLGYTGTKSAIDDCDDNDPAVWQNLQCYIDNDGDGIGTGTAQTTCSAGTCPSGYSQTGGDCDDNNILVRQCKRAFATSLQYNGNLGGLAGADSKCQARADAAALGGTWRAWISDDTTSATARLTHSTVPYLTVDSAWTKIADNWDDLADGSLDDLFKFDEFGNNAVSSIWTGTDQSGNSIVANNCVNWNSNDNANNGRYGNSNKQNAEWTDFNTKNCNFQNNRIYCIEQ